MKPDASIAVTQLFDLPRDIDDLCAEAAGQGFRFLDRLIAEWRSGQNRFGCPGEALLGVFRGGALVAVGGLNKDPYRSEADVGRVRHVYVTVKERRQGVGSMLVRRLIGLGETTFSSLRLRTETAEAASFYIQIGFQPTQDFTATHSLSLKPRPPLIDEFSN